jgi:predicted ATPase/class 3 adenylate cyclase
MRCAKCGSDNREGRKFCSKCGVALARPCPRCGASNEPGEDFCGDCGAALAASVVAVNLPQAASATPDIRITPEQPDVPNILDGERKTVTALFADIKGSMDLMEDLDPEEARAIVDPALKLMIGAARRYDGYVVQSTGDGIFALFGAPVAHEDHPQRALYAALRMQEEVKRYAERLRAEKGINLQVRVGVNTGEVVVRSITTGDGKTEYTPIGHSTSLASRLQALANPGSIAINEAVRKLAEGYFQLKPLGPARIKGVSEPVNVYEVTGLGPLRTRLQRSAGRGLTKFVGREYEMEVLRHAGEQAQSGHGQIVAVMAEPGVGKSRLFFEFRATSQSGWMVLETFSVSHGKASAYLPVLDLLHGYFKIAGEDDQRARRAKVTGNVLTLDRSLEDTLPYLFSLLGIVEGEDPLAKMDSQVKKRRTLEAIKRIMLRESLNQPLMVIFEDLHWIDDQTQELLNLLADSIATSQILLAVNYRPEYSQRWDSKTYYTALRLDPLGKESAEEMLSALLGDGLDLLPLKELIVRRTEGTPFFMEEMVQALFEDGMLQRNGTVKLVKSITAVKVPGTVQGILAARIDRLPADEKGLLQTLAVIGREFSFGLVRNVTQKQEEELERILAGLQLGEFIYEQPGLSEPAYIFKHALTQDVAYGTLLVERRKELHERTAREIETLFSSRLEDHYGNLAHHYRCSGNSSKGVEYLELAAQQAIQRSASTEAIEQLSSALLILQNLPESPQRDQRELVLQTMLGPVLIARKGNAADEVGVAYKRAVELARKAGNNAHLFPVLFGMRSFHLVRGELGIARDLGEQLLSLSEGIEDAGLYLEAKMAQGNTLFLYGEFVPALECIEQAFAIYDPRKHHDHTFLYGLDPGVFCLARIAWIFALLGHWERAAEKISEALVLAHRQSHAFSLAVAIVHACIIHNLRSEWLSEQKQAEAGIALCNEQGFGNILQQLRQYRGYALFQQGQTAEGIALIRDGMAASRATGAGLFHTYFLAMLADACGKADRLAEGLSALAEAFALVEKTREGYNEAKLHQIEGELTLRQSNIDILRSSVQQKAEGCFHKSIEIARRQQAKALELSSVMSLSRLWLQQGKKAEARQVLTEIYDWFTEGFETADLKDAKALLERLNG